MGARAAVTVVGAGMAGAACAATLRDAGVQVVVVERGRAPGGRMASPELYGRRVDLGAGYFTVRDAAFADVVQRWADRGLARPWTDTFSVLSPGRPPERTTGPMRWATPGGLRSLVRDLLVGVPVRLGRAAETLPDGTVVLAMPDPQAARLVDVPDAVDCLPTITVTVEYPAREWLLPDAAFVHDHPDVEFVADDGARRGDGAPVLVAHSTPELARRHLDDPSAAIGPVTVALRELLGVPDPVRTHVHRWSFAKPDGRHPAHSGSTLAPDGRRIGLAGDQWCPDGSPRVESAWRSGTDAALALLAGAAVRGPASA
ncbi:NAD/FAD-dependent oxidoreductase [Nakamurella endophytica]|uniref:NAD/FAD-dependent oxidoreductase n=2 Tax=Nakamurella endophytica TaxID=1748367 RepID=A0A917WCJ1_9ACTN|nr:NAD/FAD-dependent oxidoreductase [Nakamurella endophytica]